MKAYVLNAIGQLDLMEVPRPELKCGQVLVEIKAAGICGSDVPRIFKNGTYHFPTIPGHEFSGIVKDVFDDTLTRWLGKRVGVFPLIPCMECTPCRDKRYEMCMAYDYLGSRCDGGFAEYVAVPARNLIELPEDVSYEAAAMLEPAAVGIHGLQKADIQNVKKAAVFGPGTIGLLIAQWLRGFGVPRILLVGTCEDQRMLAQKLGFEEFINSRDIDAASEIMRQTAEEGADLVIDCVGEKSVIANCILAAKRGGEVLLIGNPHGDFELKRDVYWQILRKQLRLLGTWNSSFVPEDAEDDFRKTLEAMRKGILEPEKQITHMLEFDELHKGLEIMRDKREFCNKIMIKNFEKKFGNKKEVL